MVHLRLELLLQSLDVCLQALQSMVAAVQQLLLQHLLKLLPGGFSFVACVLQFVIAGLQGRQELRQGIVLCDGLFEPLAISEVGLAAQ